MICSACSCDNLPQSPGCRSCGARLEETANAFAYASPAGGSNAADNLLEARLAELESRVAVLLAELAAAGTVRSAGLKSPPPSEHAIPAFYAGGYRIAFGTPHGASIETRTDANPAYLFHPAEGLQPVSSPERSFYTGALTSTVAAVWSVLENGASNVRINALPGAGATTLLALLATHAREHSCVDGVLSLTNVAGPANDIKARLTERAKRESQELHSGSRSLILFDRADLTAPDLATLNRLLPNSRFVLVQQHGLPGPATVELRPLTPNDCIALLAEVCGRCVDEDNTHVAVDICKTVGKLAGPVRLIGIAARETQRSFISLRVAFENGDTILKAFVNSRSPDEARVLGILACSRIPLSIGEIVLVAENIDVAGCLSGLAACELVREDADGLYELPDYVAPLIPSPADADSIVVRTTNVLSAVLDGVATAPLMNRQLLATEGLLRKTFERSQWTQVAALGVRLAEEFALRGTFGAWGRVLCLVEEAGKRAGDARVLARARHDLGVRAVALGDLSTGVAYLRSAAHDRSSSGDDAGAAATAVVIALVEDRQGLAEVTAGAEGAASEHSETRLQPEQSAAMRSNTAAADPATRIAPKVSAATRAAYWEARWVRTRRALLLLTATAIVAMLAFVLWPRPEMTLAITHLSTQPATIKAGSSTRICVEATKAAVVELFPAVGRLGGSGHNCVDVRPTMTTTYVAVATSADGHQVHGQTTVDVRSPLWASPNIVTFTAFPARIKAGQSTRLCYAVSGASRLRIVPRTGTPTRLRSCEIITLSEPHRYTYRLFASNEYGPSVEREAHVDVIPARYTVAAPTVIPVMTAATAPARSANPAALHGAWEIDEANREDGMMVWYGDVAPSSNGTIVLSAHKKSIAGRSATRCERQTNLQAAIALGIAQQTVQYRERNCAGATSLGEVRVASFSHDDRQFTGSFWRDGAKLGDFNARKL